jgi:shikimate kinase
MKRHVLLVGLPGAGKSTVGALAASRLAAPLEDTDQTIVERSGRSIPALFAGPGEPAFRALEREAVEGALSRAPRVIAAGGGWAAEPGNLEAAAPRALIIYLSCAPETAAVRLAGADPRPLVASDPVPRLRELLAGRRRFYERADVSVETDGRLAAAVADEVVALARSRGGW